MKYRMIGMVCKNSESLKDLKEAAERTLREIPFAGDLDVFNTMNECIGTFKRSVEFVPCKAQDKKLE